MSQKSVQSLRISESRFLTFLFARDDLHMGVREEEIEVDGDVCP